LFSFLVFFCIVLLPATATERINDDDDDDVKRSFVLSTKSKQIEHVQFVSTLSKGRNFTINSFDTVAVFGNKVERCFDIVTCCFNIVAGVDVALV